MGWGSGRSDILAPGQEEEQLRHQLVTRLDVAVKATAATEH